MSDWEEARAGPLAGARGRTAGVVLLLVIAGGWFALAGPGGERSSDPSNDLVIDDDEAPQEGDSDSPEDGTGSATGSEQPPQGHAAAEEEATSGDGPGTARPPALFGTLLLYDDLGMTRVDLREGTSDHVALREVSGGSSPFRLTRRRDAVVFSGSGHTYAAHPEALDKPWMLGRANDYLPSSRSDRVWLIEGHSGLNMRNRVREVAVDGEVTVDWVATPEGTVPRMAVDSGLVLVDEKGLIVWDPRSGEEVAALEGMAPLATVDDRLAACASPCETLHVLDVADGEETRISLRGEPTNLQAVTTTFSPDGRQLALIDTTPRGEGLDPETEKALVLIGIRDRTFETHDARAEPPTAWTPNGRWLVTSRQAGGVLLHDTDTGEGLTLDLELPPVYGAAVVEPEPLGGFSADRPASGPRLEDGLVLSTGAFQDGNLRARDPESGEVRWTRDLDRRPLSLGPRAGPAILVAAQHEVAAIDVATGEQPWTVDLLRGESAGAPTVAGGVAYLPTTFGHPNNTRPSQVLAIDRASGEPLWEAELATGAEPQWAPPLVTATSVLVTDTPRLGSGTTSTLHALDRDTGERLWEFDLELGVRGFHEGQPLVYHGLVFVTNAHGTLFAVDMSTGEESWHRTFDSVPGLLEAREDTLRLSFDGEELRLDPATGREH